MNSTKKYIECWAILDLNEKGMLWNSLSVETLFETKKEAFDYLGCVSREDINRWKPVKIRIELKEE